MRLHYYLVICEISQEIEFKGSKIDCKKQAKRLNEFFGRDTFKVKEQKNRE